MRHRTLAALVASALISTGCATWFNPPESTHRASVVDYLYPQNERPALKPTAAWAEPVPREVSRL